MVYLEEELRNLESLDCVFAEGNRSMYAKDWYWLRSSASGAMGPATNSNGNPEDFERLQLVHDLRINTRMADFNLTDDAVIQLSATKSLA